ncbi:MAG: glycosyltransferase family 2 protein [Parvularculaceae bacterium]
MLKLSVIVLNYGTPDLAIAAGESVLNDLPPNSDLILVDNASPDDSHARLLAWRRSLDPKAPVEIVLSRENTGYSGGNNLGLKSREAEYHVLLNSDASVRKGALPALLRAMEKDPRIGVLGPRLVGADGAPQISRFRTPTPLTEFLEGSGTDFFYRLLRRHVVPIKNNDESVEPGWIGFPCVMLRGAMVREIGGLDERYFMYFEDVAYCRRAARAGWRIAQCAEAEVVHLCGRSSQVEENFDLKKRLPAYYYASRTRFYRDEYGHAGFLAANLLWYAGRAVSYLRPLALRAPTKVCEARAVDIWTGPEKGRPANAS